MSMRRFMFITMLCAVTALGYVYQQVELLKINYAINHHRDNLAVLLDQNSALMYNVNNLQSPLYLQRTLLAEKINLEVPAQWYIIGLAEAAK